MEWQFVKRPIYVTYNEQKGIEELFCKLCGSAIAGITLRTIGRKLSRDKQWIEVVERRFTRFANYAEVKMQFENGAYHISNGCKKCLNPGLTVPQMKEMFIADMLLEDFPGRNLLISQEPLQLITISLDAGGIV